MNTPQTKFTEYLQKLQALQGITDFYEYEKAFSQIHNEFGREMLEQHINHPSVTAQKKVYKKKSRLNLEK